MPSIRYQPKLAEAILSVLPEEGLQISGVVADLREDLGLKQSAKVVRWHVGELCRAKLASRHNATGHVWPGYRETVQAPLTPLAEVVLSQLSYREPKKLWQIKDAVHNSWGSVGIRQLHRALVLLKRRGLLTHTLQTRHRCYWRPGKVSQAEMLEVIPDDASLDSEKLAKGPRSHRRKAR